MSKLWLATFYFFNISVVALTGISFLLFPDDPDTKYTLLLSQALSIPCYILMAIYRKNNDRARFVLLGWLTINFPDLTVGVFTASEQLKVVLPRVGFALIRDICLYSISVNANCAYKISFRPNAVSAPINLF